MADFRYYLNRQGVRGPKGEKGDKGFSPTIEVNTNTASEYTLLITDVDGAEITDNLRPTYEDEGGTYVRVNRDTDKQYFGTLDQATETLLGGVQLASTDDISDETSNKVITPKTALNKFVTLDTAQTINSNKVIGDNNTLSFADGAHKTTLGFDSSGNFNITAPVSSKLILQGDNGDSKVTLASNGVVIEDNSSSGYNLTLQNDSFSVNTNYTYLSGYTFKGNRHISPLTAGNNITLHYYDEQGDGTHDEIVISADLSSIEADLTEAKTEIVAMQADVADLDANKQDKLTAGDNITIEQDSEGNTVISSTGGGGGTGDVTAAGDNSFTGSNTFNSSDTTKAAINLPAVSDGSGANILLGDSSSSYYGSMRLSSTNGNLSLSSNKNLTLNSGNNTYVDASNIVSLSIGDGYTSFKISENQMTFYGNGVYPNLKLSSGFGSTTKYVLTQNNVTAGEGITINETTDGIEIVSGASGTVINDSTGTELTEITLGDNLQVTDGTLNVNLDEIGTDISALSTRVTTLENDKVTISTTIDSTSTDSTAASSKAVYDLVEPINDALGNLLGADNTVVLTQSNVTAGDNVTITKTTSGIEISSTGGSSASIATTSTAGIVKPDGTTITVADDGTISVVGGSSSGDVTAAGDNTFTGSNTFSSSNGIILDTGSAGTAVTFKKGTYDSFSQTTSYYNGTISTSSNDLTINAGDNSSLTLEAGGSSGAGGDVTIICSNSNASGQFSVRAQKRPIFHSLSKGYDYWFLTSENLVAGDGITISEDSNGSVTISASSSSSVTVDTELSTTSTNPVQNSVITANINEMDTAIQTNAADIATIENRLTTDESATLTNSTKISTLEETITTLQSTIDALTTRIAALEAEIDGGSASSTDTTSFT